MQPTKNESTPTSGCTRRELLRAAGLAFAGTVLPGCGGRPSGIDPARARELDAELGPLADAYLVNGALPGRHELNRLVLAVEHLRLAESGKALEEFKRFEQGTWSQFNDRVTAALRTRVPGEDRLATLKQSLDEVLGERLLYNRDNNSLLDPVVHGRLQCRSGTQLFLWCARANSAEILKPGERLVVIYTDTHALPGKLSADGTLTGYEMTLRGAAVVDFGKLAQCSIPLRVCDADHVAMQAILGIRAHPELTVIHDTIRAGTPDRERRTPLGASLRQARPETTVPSIGLADLVPGSMRCATELYAYSSGTVVVPEGDREMAVRARSAPGSYREGGNPRGARETESGGPALARLDRHEREIVMRYLDHNTYFTDCFERHREIRTSKELNDREKIRELEKLVAEMHDYWESHGLDAARNAASAVLKRHKLEAVREPAYTHDTIVHNLGVLRRKAGQ